ncbi:ARID DNA-binding domain-containing protein [Tanacetum coccineum]
MHDTMLVYVSLVVCVLIMSGESCIEKERQALLDSKADLQDPQNMLQEWGGGLEENKDYCKWLGVNCNNHTGRVIGLDLSTSNGLAGNISPSQPLPNQLQYLNLYGIDFRSNTIPSFLGSLTNLQSLVISEANLMGPIPSQLGNISRLVHLDLTGNNLVGSIPFSLGELKSVTYLDLSFNQLGGVIPKSFGNHSSLVQLYLSRNFLNGSIPDFVRCSNLSESHLNDNNLHGGLPNFTRCSFLSVLYPFNNSLNGSIPDFTDCLSLMTLYLANNQLSVGQLLNRVNVDARHNSLDGSLSDFTRCQSQQHLNHSSNRLNGNSPHGSGQVSNLQYLDVSYNSLHGSIPDFTGCPSLNSLYLSSNWLSGNLPNSIGQLAHLIDLDVSNNSFEGVISDVHLQTFIQLAVLDLSSNSFAFELSSIPTQLETLNLQSCKLGPSFLMWLKTQKSYSHLDISSAGISDNVPVWFWDLPSGLAFPNFPLNEIKGKLQPGFSGNLSLLCHFNWGLNFLDLSNNSFSGSLPDCFQNTILVLKLSNNNLSDKIPSSLGSLSKLEALYLRSNSFAGELPMSLSNCTSLRFLDVGENKLSGVIPEWIGEKLSELYVLVLGSNRFSGRLPSQCWQTTRAPQNPIRIGEGSESLEEYQWKIDKKGAPEAVGKGKEKLEHFGIKLEEEEEESKKSQTAHGNQQKTCYKCHNLGHYAFECPLKNKRKDQNKVSSYKASTSNLEEGMDSNSTSSDDYLKHSKCSYCNTVHGSKAETHKDADIWLLAVIMKRHEPITPFHCACSQPIYRFMEKPTLSYGKWQRPVRYSSGISNKWHQSKTLGRPPRRIVQTEFVQRRNKREEEERKYGHFANKCSPLHQVQPTVSLKYPEFIHFKTRGIIKGTDEGTWDDFWIEGQKKFLFTYDIGEVIINNEKSGCMIPGVHYAPEITLNILSIDLLRQQGFELIFEEGKCTLEYMFKTKQGKNLDVDRMKQMHNNYLDDYFESLDKERIDREVEKARFLETTEQPEVHNFHGFVDFLDLIKKDEIVSREWDAYRDRFDKVLKWFYNHYLQKGLPGIIPPTIDGITIHLFDLYKLMENMGGYLSVHFGLEFGALAEVLGLTRSDGEKIRKCYETYLEVFVSYYKTARAPQNPIRIGEGSESLEEYQWKIDKKGAPEAVGKGKEKLEHFGIKLEEEEESKQSQTAHGNQQKTCYKCHNLGHYAFECPLKNKRKDQNKVSSYKASTSNLEEGMDSNSTSSDDYLIIT